MKKEKRLIGKILGLFFLSNILSVNSQQLIDQNKSILETSYLETKGELNDYILDTNDSILIRFRNKPKNVLKGNIEIENDKNNIKYLEPRVNLKEYILDTGDSVYIDFVKTPNLSGNFTVNGDGEIYLPRIKETYVKGLTTNELSSLLEKRFLEYLINPNIEIGISNFKFIPSGVFRVNAEGEINLPEIPTDPKEKTRKTFVRGLSTSGLADLLERRYRKYMINPEIFIDIVGFKPIKIYISGEVRKPGYIRFAAYTGTDLSITKEKNDENFVNKYTKTNTLAKNNKNLDLNKSRNEINISETSTNYINDKNINNTKENSNELLSKNNDIGKTEYLTTLSDAIRGAGGLTSYSNISKIEVIRNIPNDKGGGKKKAVIDFKSYLIEAIDKSDIRLYNGDKIFIPPLLKKDPQIVPKSVIAGLTEKFINVNVSGIIENTGSIKIPVEGSLSDVINLAGPRKPLAGKIYLIRYNRDGTLLRKKVNYKEKAMPGSENNPYLLSDDLIRVNNSILGRTAGTIKAITEPFIGIYTTKNLIQSVTNE